MNVIRIDSKKDIQGGVKAIVNRLSDETSNKSVYLLLYMKNCIHCKTFMEDGEKGSWYNAMKHVPTWRTIIECNSECCGEVVNLLQKHTKNNKQIESIAQLEFVNGDDEEEDDDTSVMKVGGFPTVFKIRKSGKFSELHARSFQDVLKFLKIKRI
jgi:hypothetical protein